MAALTEDQKRGFGRRVLEIMKDNIARLSAAGFDPISRIIDLSVKAYRADDKEAAQFAAQTAAEKATKESQVATVEFYKLASDSVELVVGLVGKDDELSKNLREIRDSMATEAARGPRGE